MPAEGLLAAWAQHVVDGDFCRDGELRLSTAGYMEVDQERFSCTKAKQQLLR